MQQVIVLGATGMLGSMVLDWLHRDSELSIHATCRGNAAAVALQAVYPGVTVRVWDADRDDMLSLAEFEWVVNAIGIIKPYIHDEDPREVARAVRVNALLPLRLAEEAERHGSRVLQIATDCVYTGREGMYDESAAHDATDAYGKSKSLGEVRSTQVAQLRSSIIGPERKANVSLLAWFLGQRPRATVNGYRNHQWNGVTTLHFAKICHGIIRGSLTLPHLQHVIPANDIAKADLLRSFALNYRRDDVTINPVDASQVVDRRLRTSNRDLNMALWREAGYSAPPTVEAMVAEMAAYHLRG